MLIPYEARGTAKVLIRLFNTEWHTIVGDVPIAALDDVREEKTLDGQMRVFEKYFGPLPRGHAMIWSH